MAAPDPNLEWLGHVQPTGLVVAPAILLRHGLVPEEQSRADGDAVAEHLAEDEGEDGPALPNLWPFFASVLGWNTGFVAGAPGGPPLPDDLSVPLSEADITLAPTWAVREPDGGWQLLVRIEAPGVEPDTRGALSGWEATPHQRLERLLRETGVPAGLLLTDGHLRLIYAPRGETSGWLAFPVRSLSTVGGRPMLGGLKLLLNAHRLFTDGSERRLPGLLRASREAQAEVSAKLATQVLGALHELLRGLHAADRARVERLAQREQAHLYEGLLTVLLRLIFLLYAEDRELIPSRTDGPARALYAEGYGVRTLHAKLLADRARHPNTMDERRGAWGRLLAVFRLVHGGDGTGWIRGRGGKLFDPAAFPFLEGRDGAGDRLAPPPLTDGCVLRVLDGLLMLDGEKLSYRTLDVEQIGSVYETVMGFTVLAMPGPALALKAGKNNRTPVFVDLTVLLARKGGERGRHLKEEADRGGLPARVAVALAAATDLAALAAALRPVVDERGSPGGQLAPPGTPLLQPTGERRRTGSHYTPRSLTEPIVRHALVPAFARIGPDATPVAVLGLTVCDPAMGSGAFLVEACRQLAARLVAAWAGRPDTRPPIPADEDEDLLARRLVAQRCLYGVDRNPLATDLARMSLWLATLARDHEFTFLDHALKSGDSLVGLTRGQIGALTWGDDRQDSSMSAFVRGRVAEAMVARAEIRDAPDDIQRAVQEVRHRALEAKMADVRALSDAVLACFFAHDKSRAREAARRALAAMPGTEAMWTEARRLATTLGKGPHPVRPFHWELEFPEVFEGTRPGFDVIVGNPPFLSGSRTSQEYGATYFRALLSLFSGAKHQCDYVAFFVRRAFSMLKSGGAFGLICTKTVAQGDTRESGLTYILSAGGIIYRVRRRVKWPGEAAVIVSFIHVSKEVLRQSFIDGQVVGRISAYLVEGDMDDAPHRLASAPYFSKGSQPYGQGFVFDDEDRRANPLSDLEEVQLDEVERAFVHPLFGGVDINQQPVLNAQKWIIDASDLESEAELDHLRNIAGIVRRSVKPERDALPDNSNNRPLKRRWWAYQAHRPELYRRMRNRSRFLAHAEVGPHLAFRFVECGPIYIKTVILFDIHEEVDFGVLQSRCHEVWVRAFASSMKDDLRYTASDCFQTFPALTPDAKSRADALAHAAETYYTHRAALMGARNEGLTRIYNRFHSLAERSGDIVRLRELHQDLDLAVLRAYEWDDLAARAVPEFLTEDEEPDHRYQNRLFWPALFRDEVLARLLDLNRTRAGEERALGLSPGLAEEDEDGAADEAA